MQLTYKATYSTAFYAANLNGANDIVVIIFSV